MKWEKFNKLDYLSSTMDGSQSCIVLFHGYGADANDLASLAKAFKFDKPVDWFFPQGVLEVPIGPMMSGRAWFSLRVSDFENLSKGDPLEIPLNGEVKSVLKQAAEWLNHLGKQYEQVIFGGFSQGAILSSHVLYHLNFSPTAMSLLSGFLVSQSSFPTLADAHKIPFYQSHGGRDEVLPVAGAKKLYDKLVSLGLEGQWKQFSGGHEIPMDVIADLQKFFQLNFK